MALARAAIFLAWTLWLAAMAHAEAIAFTVTPESLPADLAPYFTMVQTKDAAVMVQIPGEAAPMALTANRERPIYRWALATLVNPETAPVELVLAVPHQGLAGSGVFWPLPQGSPIAGFATTAAARLQPLNDPGQDAFALSLGPSSRASVIFELAAPQLKSAVLMQRSTYEAQTSGRAFLRGANLGIGVLTAFSLLAFMAMRNSAVFPATALFAFASVAFMMLEAGYLPTAAALLGHATETAQRMRAVAEGLMLTGLLLTLATLADLRKRLPAAGRLLLALAGLSLALPFYGWLEPLPALGLARLMFAVTAAAGFLLIGALWRQGAPRAPSALLVWGAIVLWTFICAVAALTPSGDRAFAPLIVWGLAAILMIMSFALAQFAFGQGFVSRRFFEDAGRRALALAGAQQHVWDWHAEDGNLYVGEELEHDLGLPEGALAEGPSQWLEQIHPTDRGAYLAALENAERRGRGSFSQEFRLRRGDGTYRWFLLRARAIAGPERRAIRCIGTLADITRTKQAEDRLLSDAVYDRVTGLPNRALFVDRLARAIGGVDAGQAADLHVLLLDIDRFKTVNDGLGHEIGDNLLTVMGRRLSALAGPEDTVARLPGDQFALLFVGSRPKRDIISFAEGIRKAVSRPVSLKPQEIFLTACLGVAAYRMRGQPAEALLKDAAIALYEAKRSGKDTVEFFRTTMRDDRTELVALEAELRRALERNEIEVFYQPIARLADMDLAGFEALVRWRHPTLGLLGPESFLGLAEQTGIIPDIGAYVLGEAARQLGVWQRAFRPREPIFAAVNISSSQLIGTTLVEDVRLVLAKEGIRRDTLKIEVTESIVMQNPELARGILDRLKQMGLGLACDDFGTGYSSLSNLRRLPFDTLKVDRSFISPDPGDHRAAAILEAIVALAQRLDLTVVAEGVESQLQVDRLVALGCDLGQGFFIGQPMSAKRVAEALSSHPYAPGHGKTVMAALWERAVQRDPAMLPRQPPPSASVMSARERGNGLPPPAARDKEKPPRSLRQPDRLPTFDPVVMPPPPAARPAPAAIPAQDVPSPPEPPRPALGTAPMAPRIAKPAEPEPQAPKKPRTSRKGAKKKTSARKRKPA